MGERVAVVLFNLGGPDSLEAVQPFLSNLFNDPAIIRLPGAVRRPLAAMASRRRAKVAREIYRELGGGSPLLPQTLDQAAALERRLKQRGIDARVFVSMRYWHPMSDAVAVEVRNYAPDRIVLLPLYPQYSTTTTASSLADWARAAVCADLDITSVAVCCYPTQPGFIAAIARRLRNELEGADFPTGFRVLFSAHGLPERVVASGDPYQWQVERTCAAVLEAVDGAEMDHVICYQSRVGPLKWIGPSTLEALETAAADGIAAVVVPIAFVSEHSETLVELDREYRKHAGEMGVPLYLRVPTVGTAHEFISGLADVVEEVLPRDGVVCLEGARRCPASFGRCPCASAGDGRTPAN
ncbi:MAG: ferrochelatase [Rhodospirillales bacterium]